MAEEKRRVSTLMDVKTLDHAEKVLGTFGLKSATIIQILFGRIAATGSIPFPIALTEKEIKELDQEDQDSQRKSDQ